MSSLLDLPQILAVLHRLLPALSARYGVRDLWVFGSYARRAQQADSDIDILVTFEEPPGLLRYLELENELSDLLGVRVDLVMREALRPDIGEHVLREVIPV